MENNHGLKTCDQALARLLVKGGLISVEQIPPLREFGLLKTLATAGLIQAPQALLLVSEEAGTPLFSATRESLQAAALLLDQPEMKKIELAKWQVWRCAPISLNDGVLAIASCNPLDQEPRQTLEFGLGFKVSVTLTDEDTISQILSKQLHVSDAFKLENILIASGQPGLGDSVSRSAGHEQTVGADNPDSAPVVRLVNKILSGAVSRGASDIHIEPQATYLEIRIRVNGIMESLLSVPVSYAIPVASRLKLLCGLDIAEKRKPQDGRLRIKTPLGARDLRLSTVPTAHGESLVARILSGDSDVLTLQKLGVPEAVQKRFERALRCSSRVVLVTGPTGSGKTSTLYAGLQSLANGERNIVTIEDPIEYRIGGINQIQINPKVGLTFAEGLRSIVRQDPDVVMVGEIRDQETAQIAMQTAQTGHLVLSTLHTNSAAGAVTRLKDLGIPNYLISSSLGAIVAQRLVRTLCSCGAPVDAEEGKALSDLGIDATNAKVPVGCDACNHSGYQGRTGLYSFLEITPEISEAIRSDKSEQEIERLAEVNGFQTLAKCARELIATGVLSIEEAERVLGPLDPPKSNGDLLEKRTAQSAKRRVLLVEDNENTRTILTMMLEREFYEVIGAGDGMDGLEKLHEHHPDIIVCDLMMPKMNGLQMVKKVRNDQRTSKVPILMLTAVDTEENELKLMEDGADDFVSKASDSKILVARIERLLRH